MIESLAARAARRALDVAGSAIGLVLASPVLIVAAALIRMESSGPVLFAQTRVGRDGRTFRIYKLRSMRPDTAGSAMAVTAGNDPRITRIGALLRHSKLDELPQLFNVLRGDMSLVGPRPEVPKYVAHYPSSLRSLVLSVRPGITDPVSLSFRDEESLLAQQADPERYYIETLMPEKLAQSARYVRARTLRSDLGVIATTMATLVLARVRPTRDRAVERRSGPSETL
jgi:lipopolysaccharide/colanic/teichoic acid biosynthesis glycosyltransferase